MEHKTMKVGLAGFLLAFMLGWMLRAQVLIWISNVVADSLEGFTGFSYRQGLILVILSALLKMKGSFDYQGKEGK